MAGERRQRAVSSLRDVEMILKMHGPAKRDYEVRVVALHGINQAGSMQQLLRSQIRKNEWVVDGMDHIDGVVAVHRLISRSALLLDRVIAEVLLVQERIHERRLAQGREPPIPRVLPDADSDDDDDHNYEAMTRRPFCGESPGEDHHGRSLIGDLDIAWARPRPRVRRSRSHGSLSATSRSDGILGVPPLPVPVPAPLTVRRRGDAPRFDGRISPPPAALPGNEEDPAFVDDEGQEAAFRGQVLLLEYPDPRPVGPYAVNTVSLAERMLEAGTGNGEEPLRRAGDLVGLAAKVVAGESPPRHLDQNPGLRNLATDLVESGQDLRRHDMRSDAVRSLVVELGGRIELAGTEVLTARLPLADVLPVLREAKRSLHTLWEMRIAHDQFVLM